MEMRSANGVPPTDVTHAERLQAQLRERLDLIGVLPGPPTSVVGLDVSYETGTERACGAAVVMEVETLRTIESVVVSGRVSFPYVPGLLAFREVPLLIEALGRLSTRPEVLICDGYGIAHPRRFGLACHLGVVTGIPAFGVAKTSFTSQWTGPGRRRGAWAPLTDGGEVLGCALRTQAEVKPVFVSVGHRISLEQATEITLRMSPRYRIPEPIRRADFISRQVLRDGEALPSDR